MKAPAFWDDERSVVGRVLSPVGQLYAEATAWRLAHASPWRAPMPVICVGNLTAGGAGKTPIVRDLGHRLKAKNPGILSRGYGGRAMGVVEVDPALHTSALVGDEPLMLAGELRCWVSRNRAEGARAMAAAGIRLVVMDDGLQNPSLVQDLRLVVVDGAAGFGNRRPIPAGPLRETIDAGISRADVLIVVGDDERRLADEFSGRLPVLGASIVLKEADFLKNTPVVAFAGIARPAKFRSSLSAAGARVAAFREFADHHPYAEAELTGLSEDAEAAGAQLVTTEKDWVRLAPEWRKRVRAAPATVVWRDESALAVVLSKLDLDG